MTEASTDHINAEGLALIMEMEGLRLHAYLDTVGVPTIGYGHTGPEVHMGLVWTKEQVKEALAADLDKFEQGVLDAIGDDTPTSDNEFAAMVSLAYNIGEGGPDTKKGFYNSSVARLHKAGDTQGAANAFRLYNKAGGQYCEPLARRREREIMLYLKPSTEAPQVTEHGVVLHKDLTPPKGDRPALIEFIETVLARFGL